jgi:hypothetical protein
MAKALRFGPFNIHHFRWFAGIKHAPIISWMRKVVSSPRPQNTEGSGRKSEISLFFYSTENSEKPKNRRLNNA